MDKNSIKFFISASKPIIIIVTILLYCYQRDFTVWAATQHQEDDAEIQSEKPTESPTARLLTAIEKDETDIVEILIDAGVDPNSINLDGDTALIEAIKCHRLAIVKKLLAAGADVEAKNSQGATALLSACIYSSVDAEMVAELLQAGANTNTRDLLDRAPLIVAAEQGQLAIVELLVKAGADIKVTNRSKTTPLQAAIRSHNKDLVQFLIDAGAVVNGGDWNKLFATVPDDYSETAEILKILLKAGLDANASTSFGDTILESAAISGSTELVKILLTAGANQNLLLSNGNTALHSAVYQGQREVVKQLLDSDANPNIIDHNGNTPLSIAVERGFGDIEQLLLAAGADVKLRLPMQDPPIIVAAYDNQLEKIRELLKAGTDPNCQSSIGRTALMGAASRGNLAIIELLLAAGAEINMRSYQGWTALWWAVSRGHIETAERLIRAGANVEIGGRWLSDDGIYEFTPLIVAASNGNAEMVKLLIAAKANVNATTVMGRTALTYAASFSLLDALENSESLLDGDDAINKKNFIVMVAGYQETIALLIRAKADLNTKDQQGRTALMEASLAGLASAVDLLLNAGADLNATDNQGESAFDLAISNNHCDNLASLLPLGRNRMAYLIASKIAGHPETIRILINNGAAINNSDEFSRTALMKWVDNSDPNSSVYFESLLFDGLAIDQERAKDLSIKQVTKIQKISKRNYQQTLAWLIRSSSEVDAIDQSGRTALMMAAANSNAAAVELLINAGADPTHRDNKNATALSYAADSKINSPFEPWTSYTVFNQWFAIDPVRKVLIGKIAYTICSDYINTIEMLLRNGASVNAIDNFNETPLTKLANHRQLLRLEMSYPPEKAEILKHYLNKYYRRLLLMLSKYGTDISSLS